MRTELFNNLKVSVEDINPDHTVVLSEDEQTDTLLSASEAYQEYVILSDDLKHAQAISTGMENLVLVSSSVKQASNTDLGFVDVSIEMALAGTGVSTEEALPGLEEYSGTTISTEGMMSIIKRIWKSIKDTLKRMWLAIGKFYDRLIAAVPRIKKTAESIKEKAEKLSGGVRQNAGIKISSTDTALRFGSKGEVVKSDNEVSTALGNLGNVVDLFESKEIKSITEVGKGIEKALGEFKLDNLDNAKMSLAAVAEAGELTVSDLSTKLFKNVFTKDNRFTDGEAKGTYLLGNRVLGLYTPKVESDETELAKAQRVRGTKLAVYDAVVMDKEGKGKEIDFPTLSPEKVIEFCEIISNICDTIVKFKTDDLEKQAAKVETASDKLEKEASALEEGNSELSAHVTSALNFNIAFSGWATDSTSAISKAAIANARTVLGLCSKSLSEYKTASV